MDQGVSKPDGTPGTPVPKKALIKLSDLEPGALAKYFGDGSHDPGPEDDGVPYDPEPSLSMDEMTEAYRRGADFFSVPPRAAGVEAFKALENPENLAERIKAIREMIRAEYIPLPPQVGEDLTLRQAAIRYVDMWTEWLITDLENKDHRESTVAQALGLGAALMYLAVSKPTTGTQNTGTRVIATGDVLAAAVVPDTEVILARFVAAVEKVAERGGRRGGKEGVRQEFRERDKKTRKDRTRSRTGQYDDDNWAAALDTFERLVAEQEEHGGRGKKRRVGALMRDARQSLHMTKVTDDRFRAKLYEMKRQRGSKGGAG